MEKGSAATIDVPVDMVDMEKGKLLERDSAMEMEMLELFEDITLEDVVLNKACVGKVMGCKDMPASVVKKILMGVWRNIGSWRMKKCGEGVLGFFFETEEDCSYIMDKRPWLVNGMLLNLKPWPVEGEVRVAEFEVARFWVQFHGLPTRCLSDENTAIIAKKAGQFVKTDGKSKVELVRRGYLRCWIDVWITHPFVVGFFLKAEGREESWIQFKYEKLPFLCFTCGKLAHLERICHVPTAMVIPKNGNAVQMYGPWVKNDTGRSNCFSMAGKGVSRYMIELPENALGSRKKERKGSWKRRQGKLNSDGEGSTKGRQEGTETVSMVSRMVHATSSVNDRDRVPVDGTTSQKMSIDRVAGNFGNERVPLPIGPNYLDLPNPDFANAGEDRIPDTGPTLAQTLEIPHSWVCASQRPHNYPDEVPIKWPINDPELQKVFMSLYGWEITNKFQAHPSLITNPPDLSELINHLLGTRKRKAHTWYLPIPSPSHCFIASMNDNETPANHDAGKKFSSDPEACFAMGSTEQGESSKRKTRGKNVSVDFMVNVANRLGFLNVCCIPASGLAGGLCIAWRRIQVTVMETLNLGFKVNVLSMIGCESWILFCIYGPPYGALKQPFWDQMLEKVQECTLPWALMGDLNIILEAKEKIGGRPFQSNEGNILTEFLLNSGGIDVGFVGPPATWQNARNTTQHIRKRLDRAIADSHWCVQFPNASVCHFPIYGSDHAPLCLKVWGDREKLCYPFRFMEVWTSSTECGEVIDRAWTNTVSHHNRLQRKLQNTKKDLKVWNVEKFGYVDCKLKQLKHTLEFSLREQETDYNPPSSISILPQMGNHDIPVFQVDASVSDSVAGIAAIEKLEDNWSNSTVALDFRSVHSVVDGELAAISLALSTAASKG
ncbi:hypothetical protein G4B88_002454 [Cannabis sativa]|uniref:Zinc knuckle CX2CX4HX4C domain-containing protein n=1 Tax=Cannabis sativa TaxID=3483 RepID=A0A7J6I957_CANSA|nr:hypothetical protein G4B88_002454 [Cannabis sativa]